MYFILKSMAKKGNIAARLLDFIIYLIVYHRNAAE
jgi:hypothetical protein